MTGDDGRYDRRSVLKATGVALAAGAGAAAPAAASDFEFGDCAVTEHDAWMYELCGEITVENQEQLVDRGTTGQVFDTCTNDDGVELVYFSPGSTIEPVGWVHASLLNHC